MITDLALIVEETEWTKESLTEALENHIAKEAGHFKGRCYSWDVVNEGKIFLDGNIKIFHVLMTSRTE